MILIEKAGSGGVDVLILAHRLKPGRLHLVSWTQKIGFGGLDLDLGSGFDDLGRKVWTWGSGSGGPDAQAWI